MLCEFGMITHDWNGHKIEVSSYALPKHLWMTLSLRVTVNNDKVFESTDAIEGLKSRVPFSISHDGEEVECELITGRPVSVLITRYKLLIGETELIDSKVRANNWYMLYGVFSVIAISIYVIQKITPQCG